MTESKTENRFSFVGRVNEICEVFGENSNGCENGAFLEVVTGCEFEVFSLAIRNDCDFDYVELVAMENGVYLCIEKG